VTAAVLVLAAAVLVLACAVLTLATVHRDQAAVSNKTEDQLPSAAPQPSPSPRPFTVSNETEPEAGDILGVDHKTVSNDLRGENSPERRPSPEDIPPRFGENSPAPPERGSAQKPEPGSDEPPVESPAVTDFIDSSPDVQRGPRFDWAGVDELLGHGLLARCLPVPWRARAPPGPWPGACLRERVLPAKSPALRVISRPPPPRGGRPRPHPPAAESVSSSRIWAGSRSRRQRAIRCGLPRVHHT
jgi:hypothetical protein